MKLFLDSADKEEVRLAAELGVIAGVTTNPTLIAKEGQDLRETVRTLATLVDGPISAEVVAEDAEGMIEEGRELAAIHPSVVIKLPIGLEGLRATKELSRRGIKTNVTLVFSIAQALLAARAGATYVSPFVGRLDDLSADGASLVRDIADVFTGHSIPTEIIAASIRSPQDVADAACAGAHIATVPYRVLLQMAAHPLTDLGLARFRKDWKDAFGK